MIPDSATIKIRDFTVAAREFNQQPVEKFLNKNYYNPQYMYNTEGPEILRLYNEKDNTHYFDFTSVLDSVYSNVLFYGFSGLVQSTTILSSSALSSMLFSLNGPSPIHMRKARSRRDSEGSML